MMTQSDQARGALWHPTCSQPTGEGGTLMAPRVTMQDLVTAVSENADSEAEIIATVVHMVNAGLVRLEGRLRGATFDMQALPRLSAQTVMA